MSTKKTKFEKKETDVTRAVFTLDEVHSFALTGYAAQRRDLYLQKVAQRPINPRMIDGLEHLSDISMVAEADMNPLSTRQNMARFISEPLNGTGYDADETDDNDLSFDTYDRADNPPSPHEIRARDLDRKINAALKEHEAGIQARQEGGDTPTPDGDPNPPKLLPASKNPAPEPEKPPSK